MPCSDLSRSPSPFISYFLLLSSSKSPSHDNKKGLAIGHTKSGEITCLRPCTRTDCFCFYPLSLRKKLKRETGKQTSCGGLRWVVGHGNLDVGAVKLLPVLHFHKHPQRDQIRQGLIG